MMHQPPAAQCSTIQVKEILVIVILVRVMGILVLILILAIQGNGKLSTNDRCD